MQSTKKSVIGRGNETYYRQLNKYMLALPNTTLKVLKFEMWIHWKGWFKIKTARDAIFKLSQSSRATNNWKSGI